MTCTLCGLESGADPFCCPGCRNVHAILLESGVLASGQDFRQTAIYQQSLKLGLIGKPAPPEGAARAPYADTKEAVFQLSGLWCGSCAWLIEHALSRVPGIVSADVSFASDLLKVRYSPQHLPAGRIPARVAALGYRAVEYTGPNDASRAERNDLLLRLGIAAFLWLNVMTFSLILYTSYFQAVSASFRRYIPLLLMGLATPAVFYCAAPVLRIAFAGVRRGVLRMESLLAMGILIAYGYSSAQALAAPAAGPVHVYFDTVCAIVVLVLAGKTVERGAKEQTARALALLYRLMPNKARIVEGGHDRFVSIDALRRGAIFRVHAGERIPADGVVVEGRSHADESVLTGESAPRSKVPGDAVVCGSINTGGVLEIRATRVGAESTLAHIVRAVEQAAAHRTGVERAVDRASRLFIPAVLAIAVATFFAFGWLRAIAVVVIACPCALGIATPLALTAAVAAAGRRGILVADARVFETIRKIDVVVLDKTGTATFGDFTLLESDGDTSRMAELATLESFSNHPIAKTMAAQFPRLPDAAVTDIVLHAGMGISGRVNGVPYFVGNRNLAETVGAGHARAPERGTILFGWDGAVRGSLRFGDRIRPEAAALCAALRRRGIRTLLLSGDARTAVESTAAAIGADEFMAEATPDGKVETIRRLQQSGASVAMLGDGVNDAPCLAQADLGIALGSGADIAMEAAPLVLMGTDLGAVIEILDLGRRALRIVRQNLFWAFFYNTAGITLAVAGVLSPIFAACAMVLSSLSVIANSRRLSA
jgi:heavy metal translocating P-type ATPase